MTEGALKNVRINWVSVRALVSPGTKQTVLNNEVSVLVKRGLTAFHWAKCPHLGGVPAVDQENSP